MEIGKLRHRVTLQKQINAQNDYGATVTKWRDVATVWVQSEVTTQIWLRYRDDVKSTMRVNHNGKHYEILSVLNTNGWNTSLQLMCKENPNE